MEDNPNVIIELTPLEANNLLNKLKQLADSIEAQAVREVRLMRGDEDLAVGTISWIYGQIISQSDKINPEQVFKDMSDYDKTFREEQNKEAANN